MKESFIRGTRQARSAIEHRATQLKIALRYTRTMWYLLRKRGLRALYNFLWSKAFVREVGPALLDPIWRKWPWTAPYPKFVEIEVTTKCHLRCIICEHTHWKEKPRDLTFDEFKKIIDQFPGLKWCNPTGEGSAFLNKDYIRMLRYLKSKDVFVEFVESFDQIDENLAREIIKIGIDRIWVSFDGATKDTYEKIKVGCSFEKTLKNLRNFIRIKKEMKSPIPELCFRFVITTLNYKEMPQFIELVASLGDWKALGDGSYVEFAGLLSFKEIEHLNQPFVPKEIIEETAKKAKELGVHWAFCHSGKLPDVSLCAAWTEPYIMMPGYVLPCCAVLMANKREFLRKYSFGNMLEQPFREIWNSKRYRTFRKLVPQTKGKVPILCSGCRAYDTSKREKKYGITPKI